MDQELIRALYRARAGDSTVRPLLVGLGGGVAGSSGAGAALALHLLGLGYVFRWLCCSSTSGPIGAYFSAGLKQTILGTSIYYDTLPKWFIRLFRQPNIAIDTLERVFRSGKKRLEVRRIRANPAEFWLMATNYVTGLLEFTDAKAATDLILEIKKSMAIVGPVYGRVINGAVDGSAHPFPMKAIFEKFVPTDVLVISNMQARDRLRTKPPLFERVYLSLLCRKLPRRLRRALQTRFDRWEEGWRYFDHLKELGVRTGVIYSPVPITEHERDPRRIRAATEATMRQTLIDFGADPRDFPTLTELEESVWKKGVKSAIQVP